MYSLYGKLFKYRERERRSPLEDYLTECLGDLFNRLDLPAQARFISRIFIPASLQGWFEECSASITSFRMETQLRIPSGRIDLVLYADKKPFVAIESKIGAPVGDEQLAVYGRWVRDAGPPRQPAIVCFLTHLTPPPNGFIGGGEGSGRAIPHVAKWQAVYRLLRELADIENLEVVKMLARELATFLGERGMSGEYAGRDEFAAALVYLRAGSRMDHTFSSIYTHIKSLEGCFGKSESARECSLKFDTEFKLIWGWSYLSHPMLGGLFFGYGIALEPNTIFRQGTIPAGDSVFICLGAEDRRSVQAVRTAKNEPQKPWTYAEISDWVTVISFKPLYPFFAEPEAFASKMIEWVDEEASNVDAFVAKLK
jgi:hypothetical protein